MQKECIQEISPSDVQALKRFTSLERRLLGEYPLFVSNFDTDVIRHLSGKSAYTRDMQISLFIASDENRDLARCAALINPKYQEAKNEKVGFIGYFAAAPGCEPFVQTMLDRAESWLKEHEIQRVIAPFNGSALLGMGLLTAAFDEEPVLTYGWNPPYYAAYLTQRGFHPTYPLWVYTTNFTSPKFRSSLERAAANQTFQVRPINMKRWRSDLEIFRELVNEAFAQEWEWYPATSDEWFEFFSTMKPITDPRLMLIAEIQGKAAGISIGIPNWNPLMRGFQGKLGISQKVQFLLRGGRYENAGHVFAAVRSEYRGMGIGPSLVVSVCHRYEELGLKKAFGYTINEDNQRSRKMNEIIGGIGRLLYHAYDKNL